MAQFLSVITPTNDTRFLPQAFQSLLSQTRTDWEWIILANGPAATGDLTAVDPGLIADSRVKLHRDRSQSDKIGYWKRSACERARGDIIVELDHDDQLLPRALNSIADAFAADPEAGMVYSNNAAVKPDGSTNEDFGAAYGWRYRNRDIDYAGGAGRSVRECIAPEPWPQNLSRVWYAPDHVRAWRAKAYWDAGGHDAEMAVCDDHDLICRMYIRSRIKHIDDLLYLYTVHDSNNVKVRNAEIQRATWVVYHRYIEELALKWTRDNGLIAIHIHTGGEPRPGHYSIDLGTAPNPDAKLCNMLGDTSTGRAGVIRIDNALNLLASPVRVMEFFHRVLAHGGFVFSSTPSTDGRGAFADPRVRSFWNQNSFWYWTDPNYQKHLGVQCPWQDTCTNTWFPSDWHRANNIPVVVSHLLALKDGPRFHGLNPFIQ
jgi:O-antigen biosynthesis protein